MQKECTCEPDPNDWYPKYGLFACDYCWDAIQEQRMLEEEEYLKENRYV